MTLEKVRRHPRLRKTVKMSFPRKRETRKEMKVQVPAGVYPPFQSYWDAS